jgi:hypothetical protein
MKRKTSNYLQLSRDLFNNDRFKKLSQNAKWLFVVLNELEHRFTGKKENYFFRSNQELATDSGMSLPTLKRAKAELKTAGVIETWNMHWVQDKDTGKLSEKHVSAFRIPDT